MGISGGGGMQNNWVRFRVNPIIKSVVIRLSGNHRSVRQPPQPSDMATAFSCNFNKIWPPDLVKSTDVEER
ncbi:hypothetical protein HanPI659440_Chr05g0205571 [Helianthus annuus]|nr:hypothetical protein HanPI659440_Chr05g0205571 [Helianthus annuus]